MNLSTLRMPEPPQKPEGLSEDMYVRGYYYSWYKEMHKRAVMHTAAYPSAFMFYSGRAGSTEDVTKARETFLQYVADESNPWTQKFLGQD